METKAQSSDVVMEDEPPKANNPAEEPKSFSVFGTQSLGFLTKTVHVYFEGVVKTIKYTMSDSLHDEIYSHIHRSFQLPSVCQLS